MEILSQRAQESLYYKQHCYRLNAATLLDKAISITSIGSYDSINRPLPFACLLIRLLDLTPQREIIEFYIDQQRFKYLKLIGLIYHRIVFKDKEYIERINELDDYRKVRMFDHSGFVLSYMDECVDRLLNDGEFLGFTLPQYVNI